LVRGHRREYPRLTRPCPNPWCRGRQYLRTSHRGKRGTWRCHVCKRVDKADLENPVVREFLGLPPLKGDTKGEKRTEKAKEETRS